MNTTLTLKPAVDRSLAAQARELGLSLSDYLEASVLREARLKVSSFRVSKEKQQLKCCRRKVTVPPSRYLINRCLVAPCIQIGSKW